MIDPRTFALEELVEPFRVAPGSRVRSAATTSTRAPRGVSTSTARPPCVSKDSSCWPTNSGASPARTRTAWFWRYARRLPERGEIGIFHRSHYEEVLVPRVHPESLARQRLPHEANGVDIWRRRYRQINDCERYLVENGFRVVKLFLNLSKEEQRLRFLRRCELPDRNWKLSANDALERGYWDAYQRAFAEMLDATSTAVLAQALLYIDPEPHHLGADRQQAIAAARAQLRLEAQPLDELEALVADVPTP